VVGLGTMGAGIAEVFARSGPSAVAIEANQAGPAVGADPQLTIDDEAENSRSPPPSSRL
jgi:3-hydroxyacyl-CoA dehydrogenase